MVITGFDQSLYVLIIYHYGGLLKWGILKIMAFNTKIDIHDDWMRTGVSPHFRKPPYGSYGLIWNDTYIYILCTYSNYILCIICFDQSPRFPISEQSHQGLGRPNNACIRATRGDMGTRGALRVLTPTWPRRWRPAISVGKPAKTMGFLWDMNEDLPAT